jgi:cysteine-rich repeat protein
MFVTTGEEAVHGRNGEPRRLGLWNTLRWAVAGALLPLVAGVHSGAAQIEPAGGELQVNGVSAADQANPAVAALAAGGFVVTWNGAAHDGNNHGVFARLLDGAGLPRGPEFQVNTYTTGRQELPAVAAAADGGFVIVWESLHQDESHEGVYGQLFDGAGDPRGPEFRVNTFTADDQADPAIAATSSGDFVVVWRSLEQDGDDGGIFGRVFDGAGTPGGNEFRANEFTVDRQRDPAVGMASDGGFVVAWGSRTQDGSGESIVARRFDSSGAPRAHEFVVNTYTTGAQRGPAVAVAPGGQFLVVWESRLQDGDGEGIFGQCFNGTGARRGVEFLVNTYTTGSQQRPTAAATPGGGFVVVWRSDGQDGSDSGVFGQRLDSACAPLAGEFPVNTYTTGAQLAPAVTVESDAHFLVAWHSAEQDGGGYGIFARRFEEPCGNGRLDAGEECDDGNRRDGDCCSAECVRAADVCDDGDPCTDVSVCTDDGCAGAITAVTGLACRVGEIADAPCGAETIPPKLDKRIRKTLEQVERSLAKAQRAATRSRTARIERFRERARQQLAGISRQAGKAMRTHKANGRISAACQQAIDAQVAERVGLISTFAF